MTAKTKDLLRISPGSDWIFSVSLSCGAPRVSYWTNCFFWFGGVIPASCIKTLHEPILLSWLFAPGSHYWTIDVPGFNLCVALTTEQFIVQQNEGSRLKAERKKCFYLAILRRPKWTFLVSMSHLKNQTSFNKTRIPLYWIPLSYTALL